MIEPISQNQPALRRALQWRVLSGKTSELAVVLGAAITIALILFVSTERMTAGHPQFDEPRDHHKYIHMATVGPGRFHIAPFAWRIGVPALAGLLPLPLESSFTLISIASMVLTATAIYSLAKAFAFSRTFSLIAMLMFFSLSWASENAVRDFWHPDALLFLLVTLAVFAIHTRNDPLFVALLAVGVVVKESVLVVAPLYYTLRARSIFDLRVAGRTVLAVLPALVAFVAVRVWIPMLNHDPAYVSSLPESLRYVQNDSSSYNLLELVQTIGRWRVETFSLEALETYTLETFGLVFVLPLFALRRIFPLLLRFLPSLVLVYSQLLVAVNNHRILVLGFPFLVILSLYGLDSLSRRLDVDPRTFIPVLALVIGLNAVVSSVYAIPFEIQGLVFCAWLAFAVLYQRLRGRPA